VFKLTNRSARAVEVQGLGVIKPGRTAFMAELPRQQIPRGIHVEPMTPVEEMTNGPPIESSRPRRRGPPSQQAQVVIDELQSWWSEAAQEMQPERTSQVVWTSKDGTSSTVDQMTNAHLANAIKFLMRNGQSDHPVISHMQRELDRRERSAVAAANPKAGEWKPGKRKIQT
jgi:hypothetical protein